jgi:cytochrome c peroxidase
MRTGKALLAAMGIATTALLGCDSAEEQLVDGLFTPDMWATVKSLSPLPRPDPDTTNKYADDPAAAKLGQRFFFEKGYSGPIKVGDDGKNGGLGAVGETGKVSCESCHLRDHWLIDARSNPPNTSLAIDWYVRNSPTLVNVAAYTETFGWSGFNDNLWGKALIPAEFVMGTDRSAIVHYIYQSYRDEYNAVFDPDLDPDLDPQSPGAARFPMHATPLDPGGPWKDMKDADRDVINRAYANFGKALAAYMRLLYSGNSPFDRYVAGDRGAMSASAKRGLALFVGKAACVECHKDPGFSDQKFHVTGVPQIGEHVAHPVDNGRYDGIPIYLGWDFNTAGKYSDDPSIDRTKGVTQTEKTKGAFRTKGLRSVAMTAPFFHTGHLGTLKEVVEFYNKGGESEGFAGTKDPLMKPLNLTPQEIDDLVSFLEALTGDPIPAELLQDTSVSGAKNP